MESEEDQDSLFGSPPPSPRFPWASLSLPSASICDNERRLSTSTDTQNVGTIALPGSHPYSELPLNPLALSLNHSTVHRPPAQSQEVQPTTANQNIQQSLLSNLPSRDPEFSLPDPSAPPPPHFLRNQQNLLGKAGLVAGVKPSTIAHIRGETSFNPIVIDDEDTPILGRQSQSIDSRHRHIDPSLLTAPTNEDIVSVLIGQGDIFPVLDGILGIIGKRATRSTPTTSFLSRNGTFKPPPIKKRKLDRVPAGATDWDVPYPFQAGDGPDEYHKTWERERAKDLVTQLVKLIKLAARKAAIKNYLRKEESRQAIWEKLMKPEPQNQPPPPSQVSFDSIMSLLVAAQGSTEGGGWDEIGQITGDFLSGMTEEGPVLPSSEQPEPTPVPTPVPTLVPTLVPTPRAPRPKNTLSQSRKGEILGRAQEKRRQVQEELDKVKTQLWETTIEQAALVHLLKRYENDTDGGTSSIII